MAIKKIEIKGLTINKPTQSLIFLKQVQGN